MLRIIPIIIPLMPSQSGRERSRGEDQFPCREWKGGCLAAERGGGEELGRPPCQGHILGILSNSCCLRILERQAGQLQHEAPALYKERPRSASADATGIPQQQH